jgi:hypothetical protein
VLKVSVTPLLKPKAVHAADPLAGWLNWSREKLEYLRAEESGVLQISRGTLRASVGADGRLH